MDRIINHLKEIFFKKKTLDEAEAEELTAEDIITRLFETIEVP